MQTYLKNFNHDDAKLAFKLRSNMYDMKGNFSSQYKDDINCRLCLIEVDNQSHLLTCEYLNDDIEQSIDYSKINGSNFEEISEVLQEFKEKIKKRDQIFNDILDI